MKRKNKKNKNRKLQNKKETAFYTAPQTSLRVVDGGAKLPSSDTVVKNADKDVWKDNIFKRDSEPQEVYPGFFLSSLFASSKLPALGVDVLVPLDSMYASIWDTGFRGKILYYPMNDFGVLPADVAERCALEVVTEIEAGHKVGMFCIGGRGRTGTMAAIVLGLLGIDDPIEYLRSKYKDDAIESSIQIRQIADILKKPELKEKHFGADRGFMVGAWGTKWSSYYSQAYSYEDNDFYNDSFYSNQKGDYTKKYLLSDESLLVENLDECDGKCGECVDCIWNEDNFCSVGEEMRHFPGMCDEYYPLCDYLEDMAEEEGDVDYPSERMGSEKTRTEVSAEKI